MRPLCPQRRAAGPTAIGGQGHRSEPLLRLVPPPRLPTMKGVPVALRALHAAPTPVCSPRRLFHCGPPRPRAGPPHLPQLAGQPRACLHDRTRNDPVTPKVTILARHSTPIRHSNLGSATAHSAGSTTTALMPHRPLLRPRSPPVHIAGGTRFAGTISSADGRRMCARPPARSWSHNCARPQGLVGGRGCIATHCAMGL